MAAVTICSDFGAPLQKSLPLFPLFLQLFAMKLMEPDTMIFVFWILLISVYFFLSSSKNEIPWKSNG